MLRWSINLFRVFGIQLAVHVSFFLLLAYYGYDGWKDGGVVGLSWSISLIILFFVCVVLHELGHSLTARRFGVRVPRILLLPIGGMAEFDRIPKKPSEELLITAAGPAVNFALVILLLPLCWRTLLSGTEVAEFSSANFLMQLWFGNLLMGTFNLLPVFPMDGGRIFRALLAIRLPYLRATYWAVKIGRILAPVFAVTAYYFGFKIVCILFLFIFWVGDLEYKHTLRRDEEDRYWAEMSRQVKVAESASSEPPVPPLLNPGSN